MEVRVRTKIHAHLDFAATPDLSGKMLHKTPTNTCKHAQVAAAAERANKDEGVDDGKMSFWLRKKDRLVMDYGTYPHYQSYFLAKFQKEFETLQRCDIYQVDTSHVCVV